MGIQALEQILKETGYPVAYNHFEVKKKPPYIAFYETESNNVMADNTHYCDIVGVNIELYYLKKSKTVEKRLEDILDKYDIIYQKKEIFIDSEKIYMMLYETEVVENGK